MLQNNAQLSFLGFQINAASKDCFRAARSAITPITRHHQKKRILFYKSFEEEQEDLAVALQQSLAEVLLPFYPLAGRLRSGNGVSEPALELDCTDLGVRFTQAVTSSRLSELGDFQPCEFCESLCAVECSPEFPWTPDTPLLFLQARFSLEFFRFFADIYFFFPLYLGD
ncbi:putrescine hydroxycinnamoyltransferase 2-like [Selaginella moellendorffii]|uniref:putrescine hydroxycinnamoyltransferase 2-like n=1 Tax=Selaginella moellendorffii TaxID=88036 RepID=UPI000D1C478D|nr:putrescine hydroxycinnamoyltransferase 2-like [Selaginella moellendorffii]|eukprot:XP_024530844.1 putrescine hydroxycinnamoyltransferase 2-like [Selaginella moellendorffii]